MVQNRCPLIFTLFAYTHMPGMRLSHSENLLVPAAVINRGFQTYFSQAHKQVTKFCRCQYCEPFKQCYLLVSSEVIYDQTCQSVPLYARNGQFYYLSYTKINYIQQKNCGTPSTQLSIYVPNFIQKRNYSILLHNLYRYWQ